MKKLLMIILLCFSTQIYADLDDPTLSAEVNPPQKDKYPFSVTSNGNAVSKAKFKDSELEHQEFKFNLINVDFNAVFYYDECNVEGAYTDIDFSTFVLDWHDNPFFTHKRFNNVGFTIGGFTERFCNWRILAQASVHVDANNFNLSSYAYYDLILWSRYKFCNNVNLHFGLLAYTGMKIDQVFPIIGADWKIDENWKLNAVFPVNISIVYMFDECWSLSLAGRTFNLRQRVGKNEPLSKGLFTYRNNGAEIALAYDCERRIMANIHAGYTFGGTLKIADQHYQHRRHLKFGGAPYFGANIEINF